MAGQGRGRAAHLQVGRAGDGVSLWAGDAAVKGGLLRQRNSIAILPMYLRTIPLP